MLTILGFGMVLTFMYLIMSKRLSPLVALIVIPIAFALAGGFGAGIGEMMIEGIKKIAPTGVMLMFAILYFGVMIDAGLFDPIVKRILKLVKGDPVKIVVGTAVLAMLISLDGDGSTTYMITVSAMLPLFQRLRMNALNLTCVTILASGVMNLTPWGGPTARAATALHVDPSEVFVPLIPAMVVSLLSILLLAWYLGLRERKRLGIVTLDGHAADWNPELDTASDNLPTLADSEDTKRPKLLWVNAGLTVALMAALILGLLPLPVLC